MLGTTSLIDPCGRFLPALFVHDLRDRLQGQSRRANARWGRLQRPDSQRRLLWIVSGASRESVRLGVELTRALVARRLDACAFLTYETEYPELLAPLERSPRTASGYGPSDYIGAIQAVWRRLAPLGIVVAGVAPRPNMLALCQASPHALLVAPPRPVQGRFERIYPSHAMPCAGSPCAAPADLGVLLNAPAEDADSARTLLGAAARRLWWWHGDDAAAAKRLFALFRGHLQHDVLIVSGPACTALAMESDALLRLSAWERVPAAPGTLVLADEPGWLQALASHVCAIHFAVEDADAIWPALAGAAAVSVSPPVRAASPQLASAVVSAGDENDVIQNWVRLGSDAEAREHRAQASRRAYATESRLAAGNAAELIERVCRWQ
jgi:hypothetical protein